MTILGVWLGLTTAGYLVRWQFSGTATYWAMGVTWLAMVVYAWTITSKERRTYKGKVGR